MSDDIDDFLAGLDSYSNNVLLTPLTQSQPQEVLLSSDNLGDRRPSGGLRKKRQRDDVGPSSELNETTLSANGSWSCSICTFVNKPSDDLCEMCASPPKGNVSLTTAASPVTPVLSRPPDGHWSCPMCTTFNADHVPHCESCGCDRDANCDNVVCVCGCINRRNRPKCKRCKSSLEKASAAHVDVAPMSPTPTDVSSQTFTTVVLPAVGNEFNSDDFEPLEDGSESSESDYGSDAESEEEAVALTTGQVSTFMQSIPSVNTEHIAPANVPKSMLHCGLKDFQLQAVAWMVDRERLNINNQPLYSTVCKGGLLADYMGLGKTRTIIGLCESAKALKRDRMISDRVDSAATLIVCPVSVMSQWRDEIISTVKPRPRVLIYYGSQRKHSIFQIAQEYDYVISSFHSLAYEYKTCPAKKIFRIQWHRIVLDEAHWIRNRGTNISRAANLLNANRRWVVTATPIQNRLSDLEPLISFLRLPGFSEHSWWVHAMDEQMIKCLQAILSTIMLRRTPETVINGQRILDLPPKEIITVRDTLPAEEQQFLKDLKNRVNHRLNQAHTHNPLHTYAHAFEMLVRCRQACLHRNIVIQSLRAKMGISGSSFTAEAALAAHQAGHRDALEAAENERMRIELKSHEAQQRAEMAVGEQLAQFTKLMRKKLTDISGTFVQSVLSGIADKTAFESECIICLETMTQPTLLPCAHMFCRECIASCLEVASRCPFCKVKSGPSKMISIPSAIHGLKEAPVTEGIDDKVNSKKSKKSREEDDVPDEQAFNRWLAVEPGPIATWRESTRTTQIRDLIQGTSSEVSVLVLSSFVSYLRSLEHHLNAVGITTCFMEGSMNPNARQTVISRFTQPTGGPKVLLASIGTCGVGLNLTRASLCILAEPTWNPGVEEQAVNRIHRLGQTKPVKIVRFAAKDTVEDVMAEMCEEKRRLGERLTNARMTRDDIVSVLHRFVSSGRNESQPDADN